MSRCSSLPFLPADSLIRCSASKHGPTSQRGHAPVFKDGYLYVNVADYRQIANVARHYTRFRSKLSPPPAAHHSSAGRKFQRQKPRILQGLAAFHGPMLMHNGFPNDPHSLYLQSQYLPQKGKAPFRLLDQRLNKVAQTAPKRETLDDTHNPPQLPLYYKNFRSSYKTFPARPPNFIDNLRPDPFLTPYADSRRIRQQGEPFVFTGPRSWYNTIDKMSALFKDWHNTASHADRATLDRAIDMTVKDFSRVKIKPVSYNDILSSRAFLKNRRHDTGFSGVGFSDKFELANHPDFRRFASRFKNSNLPSTYKAFWKTEALKKSKAQLLPRMILGASLESEMAERQVFQPFLASLKHNKWHTPSKIGINNQEFPRLYNHHNLDKGWKAVAVDFSKQDRYMPGIIMDARKRVLCRLAEHQGHSRKFINDIARISEKTSQFYAVAPTGEIFLFLSGHPTGLYLGAEGNTINHRVIHNYVDLRTGFDKMRKVDSQYGDDFFRTLNPRDPLARKYLRSRDRIFSVIREELGLLTTVDMWGDTPLNHHEPAFLRRGFASNPYGPGVIPVFDPNRVRNKWLVPHSTISSPQDSFDRSLGYLMLSGGNTPLFHEIRDYMLYLKDRHPEINAPSLFTRLTPETLVRDYYRPRGNVNPDVRKYVDYETFVHTSHAGGFPLSIAVPSGEGKTWLKSKYPGLFADHDDFITGKNRTRLNELTARAKDTGDWTEVNAFNRSMVPKNLQKVLLTWSPETTPSNMVFAGAYLLDQGTGLRENEANRTHLASLPPEQVYYFPSFKERNEAIKRIVPDTFFRRRVNPWTGDDEFYTDPSLSRSAERYHKLRPDRPDRIHDSASNTSQSARTRSTVPRHIPGRLETIPEESPLTLAPPRKTVATERNAISAEDLPAGAGSASNTHRSARTRSTVPRDIPSTHRLTLPPVLTRIVSDPNQTPPGQARTVRTFTGPKEVKSIPVDDSYVEQIRRSILAGVDSHITRPHNNAGVSRQVRPAPDNVPVPWHFTSAQYKRLNEALRATGHATLSKPTDDRDHRDILQSGDVHPNPGPPPPTTSDPFSSSLILAMKVAQAEKATKRKLFCAFNADLKREFNTHPTLFNPYASCPSSPAHSSRTSFSSPSSRGQRPTSSLDATLERLKKAGLTLLLTKKQELKVQAASAAWERPTRRDRHAAFVATVRGLKRAQTIAFAPPASLTVPLSFRVKGKVVRFDPPLRDVYGFGKFIIPTVNFVSSGTTLLSSTLEPGLSYPFEAPTNSESESPSPPFFMGLRFSGFHGGPVLNELPTAEGDHLTFSSPHTTLIMCARNTDDLCRWMCNMNSPDTKFRDTGKWLQFQFPGTTSEGIRNKAHHHGVYGTVRNNPDPEFLSLSILATAMQEEMRALPHLRTPGFSTVQIHRESSTCGNCHQFMVAPNPSTIPTYPSRVCRLCFERRAGMCKVPGVQPPKVCVPCCETLLREHPLVICLNQRSDSDNFASFNFPAQIGYQLLHKPIYRDRSPLHPVLLKDSKIRGQLCDLPNLPPDEYRLHLQGANSTTAHMDRLAHATIYSSNPRMFDLLRMQVLGLFYDLLMETTVIYSLDGVELSLPDVRSGGVSSTSLRPTEPTLYSTLLPSRPLDIEEYILEKAPPPLSPAPEWTALASSDSRNPFANFFQFAEGQPRLPPSASPSMETIIDGFKFAVMSEYGNRHFLWYRSWPAPKRLPCSKHRSVLCYCPAQYNWD
nr:RNA-dependent RNA polymerase [Rhizoctonia zeae yadokarivirus 2]